jgi:hypothetical protein
MKTDRQDIDGCNTFGPTSAIRATPDRCPECGEPLHPNMRHPLRPSAAIIITLLLAQHAFAWNGEAHQLVAWIAEERLSEKAYAAGGFAGVIPRRPSACSTPRRAAALQPVGTHE